MRNAGLSISITFASIHIVLMSVTDVRSRRIARLHEQSRRCVARRYPAVDRARYDKRRVGLAIGDDAIDFGVGLAEDAHRVAPGAQITFGGLLVGNRLFQIVLRYASDL